MVSKLRVKFSIGSRAKRGFSLISVMITGLVATMFLTAVMATIMPMFRTLGAAGTEAKLKVGVESVSDYVVGLLNDPNSFNQVDCGDGNSGGTIVTGLTNTMFGLPNGTVITAKISSMAPQVSNQISFDPQLSPSGGAPGEFDPQKQWSIYATDKWREVDAKVVFGGITKEVRVTLRPTTPAPYLGTGAASVSMGPNGYFNSGMLGLNQISLGSGTSVSAVDQSGTVIQGTTASQPFPVNIGANLASYQNLDLRGAQIGGTVSVFGQPNTATSLLADTNTQINQTVNLSGVDSGLDSANVLNAVANSATGPPPPNPIIEQTSIIPTPTTVPPAQSAPATMSGQTSAQSFSSLALSSSSSTTTLSGDYVVGSMSLSSGVSSNVSSPARIFVQGNSDVSNVVDVQGNLNAAGAPANLQIWYNGSGNLNIAGNVNATIYAPNASVTIGSSGAPVNFMGAIVAKTIAGSVDANGNATSPVKNLNFQFDTTLSPSSFPAGSSNQYNALTYDPLALSSKNHWTVESYQDLSR